MSTPKRMHQTTVRFGSDLWESLERECGLLGMSIAQYLREAALARLIYAAGRRGDEAFEAALDASAEGGVLEEPARMSDALDEAAQTAPAGATQLERARVELADSSARWAEGRQARRRAQQLREQVLQLRHERERRTGGGR